MWYRAGADLAVVVIWCSSASSWASFSLAVAADHLGAHPRGDIRRPSRVRRLRLPTDVAGERPAPACRRSRLSRGFIAHYLVKVIYPPGLTHGMQIGLGVLLLLVAIIGYCGFRVDVGQGWREPWQLRARSEHGRGPLSGARLSGPAGGAPVRLAERTVLNTCRPGLRPRSRSWLRGRRTSVGECRRPSGPQLPVSFF